jgi:hypothetical protein
MEGGGGSSGWGRVRDRYLGTGQGIGRLSIHSDLSKSGDGQQPVKSIDDLYPRVKVARLGQETAASWLMFAAEGSGIGSCKPRPC